MKRNKGRCDLDSCFLCRNAVREWLPAIAEHKENMRFKKGETIFVEGEEVRGIYFVFAGLVKIHKKWGKSKELIIRFATAGDIIGHRGIGTEDAYPVTGTALENTTVCFISMEFFNASLRINNDFTIRLLKFYAGELQLSERKMRNLAHMQVKGRTAVALLSLKEKFGITPEGMINIFLSKQDIASYAGTTYETLSRMLNELIEQGIISVNNKDISIINELALLKLTEETD